MSYMRDMIVSEAKNKKIKIILKGGMNMGESVEMSILWSVQKLKWNTAIIKNFYHVKNTLLAEIIIQSDQIKI